MQRLAQAARSRLTKPLPIGQVYSINLLDLQTYPDQHIYSFRFLFSQERGVLLYLRYVARWGAFAIKNRLNLSSMVPGRHGEKYVCPCQYIEEHLKTKPPAGIAKFFALPNVQFY